MYYPSVILVALLTMLVMMSGLKCEQNQIEEDLHQQHEVVESHSDLASTSPLTRLLKKRSSGGSFQEDSDSIAPASKSSSWFGGKKRYNYRKRIQLPFKWGKRSQQADEVGSDRVQEVCDSYAIILAKQRGGQGVVKFLSQLSKDELEWLTVNCDGRLNNGNNVSDEEHSDSDDDDDDDENAHDGGPSNNLDNSSESEDASSALDGADKRKRSEKVIQLKRYNYNIPFRWGK